MVAPFTLPLHLLTIKILYRQCNFLEMCTCVHSNVLAGEVKKNDSVCERCVLTTIILSILEHISGNFQVLGQKHNRDVHSLDHDSNMCLCTSCTHTHIHIYAPLIHHQLSNYMPYKETLCRLWLPSSILISILWFANTCITFQGA